MQNVISAEPVQTATLPSGRVIATSWTVTLACGCTFEYVAKSIRFARSGRPLSAKCKVCGK